MTEKTCVVPPDGTARRMIATLMAIRCHRPFPRVFVAKMQARPLHSRLPLNKLKQQFARPGGRTYAIVGAVAFLQFCFVYARVYSPGLGITQLLQVGQVFEDRGTTAFRSTPKFVAPGNRWGFDGQFYAEIALDPLLLDPGLQAALDNPPYRAQRILMPWLAWAGGLGRPFWILNVYAALNLVFWAGFAVLMAKLFRPYGWAGVAGYAAMLITGGIIESMHASLTDFPAFVLMTWALMVGGTGGAGLLALSTLAREANIIGILGLWSYRRPWLSSGKRNMILGLIAGLPCLVWFAYVMSRFPPSPEPFGGGNLTWPMGGIMARLGEFSVEAVDGGIRWSKWYSELYSSEALHGFLLVVATLTQCAYLLIHREWNNRIWRLGAIFVPYFLCISYTTWEAGFTITRHALPITLGFNLVLALRRQRGWLVWFLLGNCFSAYPIYQFTVQGRNVSTPPPEFQLTTRGAPAPALRLEFGEGWSFQEWTRNHTWRWSMERHASLKLFNPEKRPVAIDLAFIARSVTSRDAKISVNGANVWSTPSLQSKLSVVTSRFSIPPGATQVSFDTEGPPVTPTSPGDLRLLSIQVQDLRVEYYPLSPGG